MDKTVSERFVNIRKTLNVTQGELAKRLGVGLSAIGMIESGERLPSREVIVRLIDVLSVNINWLFSGKGSMFYADDGGDFSVPEAIEVLRELCLLDEEGRREVRGVIRRLLGR